MPIRFNATVVMSRATPVSGGGKIRRRSISILRGSRIATNSQRSRKLNGRFAQVKVSAQRLPCFITRRFKVLWPTLSLVPDSRCLRETMKLALARWNESKKRR